MITLHLDDDYTDAQQQLALRVIKSHCMPAGDLLVVLNAEDTYLHVIADALFRVKSFDTAHKIMLEVITATDKLAFDDFIDCINKTEFKQLGEK